MYSLRRWMLRPKKNDSAPLAQFFYADEELNVVAAELDSFDGRKDPERCTSLVNQLRSCQDKVLTIIETVMQEIISDKRASHDFRVKFPDDVLQEGLAGQLWFGAECLAAGSSIMNREVESASMRPLAKTLTRHLDYLRSLLREQSLRATPTYSDAIIEALTTFDKLFAEFELSYVSAMVPVKTMREYDLLQEVMVLFCEAVERALKLGLLTHTMLEDYDPGLMFTIPRLAIVAGLIVYPEGPLNPDMDPNNMCEMFRPFHTLLYKIRELLWTLSREELWLLEKSLCSMEGESNFSSDLQNLSLEDRLNCTNQDEDGIEGEDVCGMSHSTSTVTVVTATSSSDTSTPDTSDSEAADHIDALLQVPEAQGKDSSIRHQDSTDSGMSESEPVAGAASRDSLDSLDSVARRLRHSRSWPESNHSKRKRKHVGYSIATGNSRRVEEDAGLGEDTHRATFTHRAGSREFNFHLPLNTETDSIDRPNTDGHQQQQDGIIYTGPRENENQISFITDTLNHVFVTDPTFSTVSGQESTVENNNVEEKSSRNADDVVVPKSSSSSTSSSSENSCDKTGQEYSIIQDVSPEGSSASVQKPQCSSENVSAAVFPAHCDPNLAPADTQQLLSHSSINNQSTSTILRSCGGAESPSSHTETESSSSGAIQIAGPLIDLPASKGKDVDESEHSTPEEAEASCIASESRTNYMAKSDPGPANVNNGGRRCDRLELSTGRRNGARRGPSPSIHSVEWDRESYSGSSETSSYTSDCGDDEEIALAIAAAEAAARKEARARFKTSHDLIHRLFVCISGVADQLQTNYAADLRHILKVVFESTTPQDEKEEEEDVIDTGAHHASNAKLQDEDSASVSETERDGEEEEVVEEDTQVVEEEQEDHKHEEDIQPACACEEPPQWVPDEDSPHCTACKIPFTFVRRRHHCRNCGKIFCGRCSSNSVPLPHFGHAKPVRVCNHCFMFQVTPFMVND